MDVCESDDLTCDDDLASWHAFTLAYYEPIRRALRLLRVDEAEIDEMANSFVVKAANGRLLGRYHEFQAREAQAGRRARFRTYLYRSVQHHLIDHRRRMGRSRDRALAPDAAQAREAPPAPSLDSDALFALDVLHQGLQALRRHCERTGKAHIWTIFEELILAEEYRGRKARTREELLAAFPGARPQFLDNCLTTAKRSFRRIIQEVIPRGLRDGVPPAERFEEWMAVLRESNAAQFNLLHVAYQVAPRLTRDMSQTASLALVVDDRRDAPRYEEPSLLPDVDELGLLLGFRLELPLGEVLDASELQEYLLPDSPLWPLPRPGRNADAEASRPGRPFCLLTLIEPTPEEARALAEVDLVGLLARLKSLAKQLRRRPDHTMPEVFAQLLYTAANVLALVRFGAELHTIGSESLARNVRWFLKQPWLDDRLIPLFEQGLAALGGGERGGPKG